MLRAGCCEATPQVVTSLSDCAINRSSIMHTDCKLGVVFLHHDITPVVQNNLASIRQCNPNAAIATISAGDPLPGGYTIRNTPEWQHRHAQRPRKSADMLLCSWFHQRREKCDKWWIAEWDVYARQSVEAYYQPVWNYPFVASDVALPYRRREWPWFRFAGWLPPAYRGFALGAIPALWLLSEEALCATCNFLTRHPTLAGNGELRFGSAANAAGFPPCGFSPPPHDRITWVEWKTIGPEKTIFHPVKHIPLEK